MFFYVVMLVLMVDILQSIVDIIGKNSTGGKTYGQKKELETIAGVVKLPKTPKQPKTPKIPN